VFGRRKLTILEKILRLALNVASEAEVFYVESRESPVRFEANHLKSLDTREASAVGLRLVKDGRVGFAATSRLADVQKLVDNAVELAPFGAKVHFEFPGATEYPSVPVYDPLVENVALEEMIQIGQTLIDRIRAHSSDVQCEASIGRSLTRVKCLNSRGGEFDYTKSAFGIGIEGTVVRGEDMLFVGEWDTSCRPLSSTVALETSVIEQLDNARDIAKVPSKRMPVIFTPHGVAGLLLAPLLAGFNGKNIVQGMSPLIEKLGLQTVDQRVTIVDDPLLPYIPGSRICDDEGVPSQRTPLLDHGVVKNFLFDLQTAAMAGKISTGNAARGVGSLPAPGASVLVIDEGDMSYRDMIADVKDGIIVEQLLGAGQSNILSGDFNANVLLGYRIECGRIVGRAKNVMVSGNVYSVLNDLVALGSEARWVGGGLKSPALYCRGVSVASKS
jgi:PmbA protein